MSNIQEKMYIHCPSCGYGFSHAKQNKGKLTGGASGLAAGAMLGAKVGIAMGPLGAIAGTIPGAILGGLFGKDIGKKYDNPRCPSCGTKFQIPESLR
jgi:DNA-directed RNA polymerase subunit RPC12/RpoP